VLKCGMRKPLALVLALPLVGIANAQLSAAPVDVTCDWSAQLTAARPDVSGSYQVPFKLRIERTSSGLRAALANGSDRIDFSSITQQGSEVSLRLDQYDATLSAHCSPGQPLCDALEGEYVRQKGSSLTRYKVAAHCERSTSASTQSARPVSQVAVASDWLFAFTDSTGKPASETNVPAHFIQAGNHIEGTIAPVSGDYGLLSGERSDEKAALETLSRFDGIHALRLDGHVVTPDRIEGMFYAAPGRVLNFVATRAPIITGFDEAEHLTSVENPAEPFRFHAKDASGATVTQDDPSIRGKVVILDIFGTWCPNCHDEAPVLQLLYAKYHSQGLEIMGLSYEYVDDPVRSQRLLQIYRHKYSIEFPLLLAGTTDSGQIATTLPQLRNFEAYPTTVFIDRHGRVRLIHAGFSGPATGRLQEVTQSFERTIVKLLNEK